MHREWIQTVLGPGEAAPDVAGRARGGGWSLSLRAQLGLANRTRCRAWQAQEWTPVICEVGVICICGVDKFLYYSYPIGNQL